jgi:hypothetical protein
MDEYYEEDNMNWMRVLQHPFLSKHLQFMRDLLTEFGTIDFFKIVGAWKGYEVHSKRLKSYRACGVTSVFNYQTCNLVLFVKVL